MRSNLRFPLLALFLLSLAMECHAAIPPEVRRELLSLTRELRGVTTMIRKKEVDEAKALIKKVEEKVAGFEIDPEEKDRTYRSLVSAARVPRGTSAKSGPVRFRSPCAGVVLLLVVPVVNG